MARGGPIWVGVGIFLAVLSIAVGQALRVPLAARGASTAQYPPLPADAGTHRLLPLPAEPYSKAYTFERTHPDGSPVTWDPCRPIHYVIESEDLPSYGVQLIHQAIAQASGASGLKFVQDGKSDEPISFSRALVQKARYGDRWAPVLIGFTDPKTVPDLAGSVVGLGGAQSVSPDGLASARYVTGTVALDRADFDKIVSASAGQIHARAAIMHELGHLLGLGHVRDGMELMYPQTSVVTQYGPGDRHGLWLEGSGLCHHDM